jgi:phage protein D
MTQPGTYSSAIVHPMIRTGADRASLPDDVQKQVIRTIVDTHLHLPGMFELTFLDERGTVVQAAGLSIGTEVQVLGQALGSSAAEPLITGEVTSIEGVFERRTSLTVVRGYDKAHRLQRTRRTRTFLNMKDSEIASQLATEAGLTPGHIEASATTHAHLGQCQQTDWEFLSQRAREIGFETGMSDTGLYFRKASTVSGGTGEPPTLTFGQNLRAFRPRLTAGNLAPNVEVRVWDPARATVVAASAAAATGTARLAGEAAAAIARRFAGTAAPAAPPQAGPPAARNLGPVPGTDAFVVFDRPAGTGAAATAAAAEIAGGVAEHIASTFAEAEGDANGSPAIQAGGAVQVTGVPAPFAGTWMVTNARHVFDVAETGYVTRFVVSGRQERSLLALASAAASIPAAPRVSGVACAVVTNNNDPARHGQVKVALPWLSPDYESDWAPVAQFGAGKRSGAMFLPEVGDEVLVGFEFGDPRRPYVLGGIVNSASSYDLGGPAVKTTGQAGEIVRRGFVSAAGNQLAFHDELPPGAGGGKPIASDIKLGTADGGLAIKIDQVAGTVMVTCKPTEATSQTAAGHLTIECGGTGTIDIKAGPGGTVNIDGGDSLSLRAQQSIKIESPGQVTIKGAQITLN